MSLRDKAADDQNALGFGGNLLGCLLILGARLPVAGLDRVLDIRRWKAQEEESAQPQPLVLF